MEYYNAFNSIPVCSHHIKQNICGSRAKYRDGKKDTAVKVYTVNQESIYILVTNVPAIGGSEDLRALCDQYGIVDEFQPLDDYPCEEFTETYLVKYNSFPSARTAKKHLDDKSFLGSTLHVFYAPEFESFNETRLKLQERRKYISWKINKGQTATPGKKMPSHVHSNNNDKSAKPNTVEQNVSTQPVTYVWAGKEYTVYPGTSATDNSHVEKKAKIATPSFFVPRQLQQKMSDSNTFSNVHYAQNINSSNSNLSHVDESSFMNTVSHVRKKVSNVSVPNVRVSLKRRKRM